MCTIKRIIAEAVINIKFLSANVVNQGQPQD